MSSWLTDMTKILCLVTNGVQSQLKTKYPSCKPILRFAFVGYRDLPDSPSLEAIDFSENATEVAFAMGNSKPFGGECQARDIHGALERATFLKWSSPNK